MKFLLHSLLFLLLFSFGVAGQQHYQFSHLNKEDNGLAYNGVRTLFQDTRGYVWVGTHNGLSRYDGTRFKNYSKEEMGGESSFITALEEDDEGNIWIGTDKGLVLYSYRTDSFMKVSCADGKLLESRIFAICHDGTGRILVGTRSQGLYVYDSRMHEASGKQLSRIPMKIEGGGEIFDVYRITVDADDHIWVVSYCDNIYQLAENEKWTPLSTEWSPEYFLGDDIQGIAVSRNDNDILYIASKRHGLCQVRVSNGSIMELYPFPKDQRPTHLFLRGKILWACTTGGLLRFDLSNGEAGMLRYDRKDVFSLSDDYVTCALVDRMDGLWIGTENGGINYCGQHLNSFQKIYRITGGESLEGCFVKAFAQDEGGIVWVGTERRGLLKYNPMTGEIHPYGHVDRLPESITALCQDRDVLWIGGINGLYRLRPQDGQVRSYSHFGGGGSEEIDNRIVSIFRTGKGDLYAGTAVGVLKYDRQKDEFALVDALSDLTIEHMAEDNKGNIWMASYTTGAYAYSQEQDRITGEYCIRNGNSCVSTMTSSMCIDEENRIWVISFSSGFYLYDKISGEFSQIDMSTLPSLPTNVFFTAVSDGTGALWLSSDSGLIEYRPSDGMVKVFTKKDGLLDDRFTKSACRLTDGRILQGSMNGFICFDPSAFKSSGGPTALSITEMTIKGVPARPGDGLVENIDISERIKLRYNQNTFGFSITPLDAPSMSYGQLLCRLDGLEETWRNISTSNEAVFYNVPAGTYRLELASLSEGGIIQSAHKNLEIVVEPPFWGSTKGLSLITAMVILASVLLLAFIYRRMQWRDRRKREEFRKKQEEQLYNEKITFFSNIVHEIKTPLTLIKTPLQNALSHQSLAPAVKDDLEAIATSTDYLDHLVRELLEFVRVEKQGYELVTKPMDIVERTGFLCFNYAAAAKSKNIDLRYRHDEDSIIVEADDSAMNKILNNLLHNAFKYAETWIDVHVYEENGKVVVSIRNDGPEIPAERREEIFKPFVQYSQDKHPYSQSFGIGLSLARTFAQMHGGSLVLDSDTTCTKFVLSLPSSAAKSTSIPGENSIHEPEVASDKPLIIVAEDNDDLSGYLKRKLEDKYCVITAPSGEKALALLKRYDADVLITDIAMHNMSGVELCRRVSTDFEISHIPIIVVSAITSDETKIECMTAGAMIYIEKPFNLEYLESCIKSVIDRKDTNKRNPETDIIDPQKVVLQDINEEFLRRLDAVIMDHLQDPDFSNCQMEEMLFLSHSTLNRKVKTLLNTTPNDYLRTKRLGVAAQLLSSSDSRVNEICYAVGFNSPSYFARCFREQHGMTPAEYRKQFSQDGK